MKTALCLRFNSLISWHLRHLCQLTRLTETFCLGQGSSRRLQPDQAPRPQPLQQPFQYDEDVASPQAPLSQTLPGLARPSPSMASEGDAAQTGLKRLIIPGATSSLTPQGSFQPARESMPSRTSSGIPGSATQKEDEQVVDASGSALDSSLAKEGGDPPEANREQVQTGSTSQSHSSQAQQQDDALPKPQSEQPEVQAGTDHQLSDKQRTEGANSATASAALHAGSSQQKANVASASSESRPRRNASSSSKDNRPQSRTAQGAQRGPKQRSTVPKAAQESKAPGARSRKGDAALFWSHAPHSIAIQVLAVHMFSLRRLPYKAN